AGHAEVDGGPLLLDEGDVAPGVGAERAGVVERLAEEVEVLPARDEVPLLAGDLAGLAADAHARVGEEALARRRVLVAGVERRVDRPEQAVRHHGLPSAGPVGVSSETSERTTARGSAVTIGRSTSVPARARYPSSISRRAGPRGRRPGSTSQVPALVSWMRTLGSRLMPNRSLAASPVTRPRLPQW